MINRRLFVSWIWATWLGWLLGIPFIIVLALLGEAVGIGGAQFLVGVGMGAGVGLMQARILRRLINRSALWICSCVVGLGLPFLITDVSRVAGLVIPYSLVVSITVGGLISGGWQMLILRSRVRRTGSWMVASALGWTLAAGTSAVADSLSRSHFFRGIWGAIAYLGIVASGGLILGLVTGASLVRMFRDKTLSSCHFVDRIATNPKQDPRASHEAHEQMPLSVVHLEPANDFLCKPCTGLLCGYHHLKAGLLPLSSFFQVLK